MTQDVPVLDELVVSFLAEEPELPSDFDDDSDDDDFESELDDSDFDESRLAASEPALAANFEDRLSVL